jgi:uncharacterized SAM-binding protein YcdF (DUF218 family)
VTSTLRPPSKGARRAPRPSLPVRRWAWRVLAALALLIVLYVGLTFVQVWLASRSHGATSADAIVVLGAAQYDCTPSPVLERRLDHAHALYADGVAGTIVVTGGKQDGDRCTEAESSATYLRELGVPDEALLLEVQGRNSWESLAATAHILRERDLTRAVLVTDGYHALRARAISDQLGLDASVSPSRPGGSLGALIKETAAVAVGRLVGFERLVDIDDDLPEQLDDPISTDSSTSDVRSPERGG